MALWTSSIDATSSSGDPADLTRALQELDAVVPGRLHLPGTAAYDEHSTPWNVAVTRRPVAVVAAASAADVAAAVRWADRNGVTVAVQATGHGAVGDLEGSLLISTRDLASLEVDPPGRRARVGAGVRWAQVLEACAPHGLAGLAGSAPHVGVVGYVTGGGIGPVARTCGLASDRVRAFEVVTGDGVARRATPTEDPDLYWALRGGRGLLGIVTAVEIELLDLAEIHGGALYFDGADAERVLTAWGAWSAELPEEATTSVAFLRLPPMPGVPPPLAGRLTVAVRFAWCGDPAVAEEVLEPMRSSAVPLIDAVATMPYAALGAIHADPVDPMPTREDHALLGSLDAEAIATLLRVAGPTSTSEQIIVEVRQLGGALARPGRHSSAFDHRAAAHSLLTIGLGVPPMLDAVAADGRAVLEALAAWTVPGILPTFSPGDDAAWLGRAYSPATVDRLARLARSYDPRATIHGAAALRCARTC